MAIDPNTFGKTPASVVLSQILFEMNNKQINRKTTIILTTFFKLIKFGDNLSPQLSMHLLELVRRDFIESTRNAKVLPTIVKDLILSIISAKFRESLRYYQQRKIEIKKSRRQSCG
jgi:hypothetical protein